LRYIEQQMVGRISALRKAAWSGCGPGSWRGPSAVPRCAGLVLLTLLTSACTCQKTTSSSSVSAGLSACDNDTPAFLKTNRHRYLDAIAGARTWLDGLHVDPLELREHGIKGKKKLTEQLDGYYRLWQIAEPAERPALQRRIEEVVAVTYESRYHDMAKIGDQQFKQDATSYLRTAVLMDRLGLDTAIYREEIRRIHPRLNAHMSQRGPHQRAVFHWYYGHFGLEEPFPLSDALEAGYIARRADPNKLDLMDVYQVTHEVFAPYAYGERLDVDPFSDEDKVYLRTTLDFLTERYIAQRNPDLVAELVSCMRLLRFVDSPVYRNGLSYLLQSQNPDGSWGDLERNRRRHGPFGRHHVILHTTMVALDAVTIAFHDPWNRDLLPQCGS
jgi:hypothetical protein